MKKWIHRHPDMWQFILFNLLANCATVTNFVLMWLGTGMIFKKFETVPFQFFVFNYTTAESKMLCGFLSFLLATVTAQIVNYKVQKNITFKSGSAFTSAAPKYIVMIVVIVIVSTILPGYTQKILYQAGISGRFVSTIANCINILVQIGISYPAMKFYIMKD